jgi:hypothetical protein
VTRVSSVYGLECVYCGEPATDRDHVVAHSLVNSASRDRTFDHDEVVPACKDCNGALNNKPLVTIAERAHWLSERLKKKLDKMPIWEPREIDKLGRCLQSVVNAGQLKRKKTERRVEHLEQVAQLRGLTPERYWETNGDNMYIQ